MHEHTQSRNRTSLSFPDTHCIDGSGGVIYGIPSRVIRWSAGADGDHAAFVCWGAVLSVSQDGKERRERGFIRAVKRWGNSTATRGSPRGPKTWGSTDAGMRSSTARQSRGAGAGVGASVQCTFMGL